MDKSQDFLADRHLDPISEVGSEQQRNEVNGDNSNWRLLFEMQNATMKALVEALNNPQRSKYHVTLPEFDPDKAKTEAQSWCATVDLCLADSPLEGGQLIVALSKALKGTASSWLAQISYPGMTWSQFKALFTARFVSTETTAGTLINLSNDKPKEGETLAAYGSRVMTSLAATWKNATMEEIVVSMTLAHLSQFDTKLQRLAFTTDVKTRKQLQQELQAFVYLKRKASDTLDHKASDSKRIKMPASVKCFLCGKPGHKVSDCYHRAREGKPTPMKPQNAPVARSSLQRQTASRSIICFKCGKTGHISTLCTTASDAQGTKHNERRVDVCIVDPPAGKLKQQGRCLTYHFDSGAECSIVKESVSAKLLGHRIHNIVTLRGISNTSIVSTFQIFCIVEIGDHSIELLLHVLPDEYLRTQILIGREILQLGFSVNMTATQFTITKIKNVNNIEVPTFSSSSDIATNNSDLSSQSDFSTIDTDIPIHNRAELVNLLTRYSDYFITGMPNTRVTTGELEIKLIDPNLVVQRRPYRFSAEERKIMRDRVNVLLRANIIRPSSSPFAIPALLVKKRDGSDRMCIDYRELNNNTVSDRYPLPLISDLISRLHGAHYFTKLDCASGFHLIPINCEDSIHRTAFITPDGHYECLTMPFGLKNAISVFQRAIIKALGDLANTYVIVYVDDILITSLSVEEGISRLNVVLETLTKAGFSLNLKKCSFLKTKLEFLGFDVRSGKIRPNHRKVESLSRLPPPTTVTQLRQFIGLATYFRQFIPKFSSVMGPLYRLTANKVPFTWKRQHEDIRQKIVALLTEEPVLMIFDPQYPVELHTDASSEGYGAILFQIVDGKRKVVAYFSKRTTGAESHYTSYDLETLAVVNAIKQFRQFLHGRKFRVVTDCNSLKSSRNKIELTPRGHRWWAYLQCFDFDISYNKGKEMAHADFLSRNHLPIESFNSVKLDHKRIDLTELTGNWLLAEQKRDSEISRLISDLGNGQLSSDIAKTYEVRSGVLHRKIQRNGKTKCLPILPRALRLSVVSNVHESLIHLGYDKTLEKLYDFYWFEGMARYVNKFVDNCVTCKVSKSNSGKIQAQLHPIPKVSVPWHTVHIDATGKLSGKNDLKEYVFVLIDAFTKYVLLFHSTNIDSKNSIKAVKESVALFGSPIRIIADQGRCFASREFKDFCDASNIKLHLIATGSCRANGQVERVMSVLKSMLTAVETDQSRSWQDALGEVQLAINCSINRTTKVSPLELLIGKVARPLSLMTSDSIETEVDLESIRNIAVHNIESAASYDKSRFDKSKAKLNKFSVGDFVLIKNEERNQVKLDPKYRGPFQVVDVLEGDRYTLKALNSKRSYKYAHDRLRKMPDDQDITDETESSV